MSGDESERARDVICQAHGMTRVGNPGDDDGHVWDRLPDLLVQQIQAAVVHELESARKQQRDADVAALRERSIACYGGKGDGLYKYAADALEGLPLATEAGGARAGEEVERG